MKFSVRVNNDLGFSELRTLATAAEQAGFDQLWVSNDLFLRSAPVLMGALAAGTDRIGLGIAVMNPYSVHVSELAMVAATLQEVSGGRFLLGLGAGWSSSWAGPGSPGCSLWPRPGRRWSPCGRCSATRTWTGRCCRNGSVRPACSGSRWPGRSRSTSALWARRCSRWPAWHADGVLPLLYPPERYASVRLQVLAGAEHGRTEHGRRDVDLPACFWVSLSDDPVQARTALAEKLAYYGPSISAPVLAAAGLRPQDFAAAARLAHDGHGAAQLIDDRMLSLGVAGDVADVLARCRVLRQLGAHHLSFGPPLGPDPVAAIRLLGDHVLPALAELGEETKEKP